MKMKTEIKEVNVLEEFVSAFRDAEEDRKKAIESDSTAGQRGAWCIACWFESGKTIDESLAEMRGALKKAKLGTGKLDSCRKLVGHAISLRKAQDNDAFPVVQWHSVNYYARVEDIANKTSSGIAGTWSADHAKALNKIKDSKGIPFLKSFCQKYGIAVADINKEVDLSRWDKDFLTMSKPASKEAEKDATSEQLYIALVKRGQPLKVAISRLSQPERSSLIGLIEVVNQEATSKK